ncbi:HPr family phosphocarrier protein [Catellatospora sp. KI3]|uniref:HPr family phosphocarrier protein n=1 Tax=Catellatospora sp. KI3 TaxID=3041620 RepID=UPI0024827AB0|nr:HPr family phosphocarrier protein [Catellatospora sp. KI3]MDI1462531.1 HPr family phosphocarrier protein [Catellatospora sp. KI3]
MPGSCETDVVLGAHLHARPAGQVVRAAARFSSDVEISFGGRTASARGILGLLALGATAGQTVTVRATGDDAPEALAAIVTALTTTP